MAELHDVEVHIGLLAVDPDRQNLGLGKKLIAAAEKYALNHFKCGALKMFVLSGRDELLAWYLKLGYSKTGETVPFCVSAMGTRPVCNDAHFIAIAKTIP
jgi:ribosomal protein S18 acetylase RimI-like enzyme